MSARCPQESAREAYLALSKTIEAEPTRNDRSPYPATVSRHPQGVSGRGRYWDRTSHLCHVKAYQGVTLTWGFAQKPAVNWGLPFAWLRSFALFASACVRSVSIHRQATV